MPEAGQGARAGKLGDYWRDGLAKRKPRCSQCAHHQPLADDTDAGIATDKRPGALELPLGIQFSGDWQLLSGRPIFTAVRTPSGLLRQGRLFIFDIPKEEETIRAPRLNLVGFRVQKAFSLGGDRKIDLSLDVLNAFNDDSFYEVSSTTVPSASKAYLQGITFVPPRRANAVIKVWF